MPQDTARLTTAIELVAAGSWAIDSGLRCLDDGDTEAARAILSQARGTVREGLTGLQEVLEHVMRDAYDRPERLARALASLEELRDLAPPGES